MCKTIATMSGGADDTLMLFETNSQVFTMYDGLFISDRSVSMTGTEVCAVWYD